MSKLHAAVLCVAIEILVESVALGANAQQTSASPAPQSSGAPPSEAPTSAPTSAGSNERELGPPGPDVKMPAGTKHAASGDVSALAKATQNPVGDLVAIPFQFNFDTGGGLADQTLFNLNFQPVIPMHLAPKLNLIARTILPVLSVLGADGTRSRGMGDIQEQLFFSPAQAKAVVWGFGPILSFPTATVPGYVTGSWGLGPSGVTVVTAGPVVAGALVSQLWAVKDNGGRPRTNALNVQPFINYNFGVGWALGLSPMITANWDAGREETWTLPLGGSISRTFVFQKQPMTLSFHYYRNVLKPDASAANQLRAVVNFLFPG
jgi:hypothetical protein